MCTGNICRSPLIERLLQASVDLGSVRVRSAGTHAMVGQSMTSQAADEAIRLGAHPDGHVARYLTAAMVAQADLVLTATRAHRAAVVTLVPRASRYAFTLRELGRLLEHIDADELPHGVAERVRALPAAAAARRGLGLPPPDGADDVTDPIGGSGATYRRTTEQILPPLTTLVRVLTERPVRLGAEDAGGPGLERGAEDVDERNGADGTRSAR